MKTKWLGGKFFSFCDEKVKKIPHIWTQNNEVIMKLYARPTTYWKLMGTLHNDYDFTLPFSQPLWTFVTFLLHLPKSARSFRKSCLSSGHLELSSHLYSCATANTEANNIDLFIEKPPHCDWSNEVHVLSFFPTFIHFINICDTCIRYEKFVTCKTKSTRKDPSRCVFILQHTYLHLNTQHSRYCITYIFDLL